MSKLTRRQILAFFGGSAGAAVLAPMLGNKLLGGAEAAQAQTTPLTFTPVRLPHPLPIYQQHPSFLATGIGQGSTLAATSDPSLSSYTPIDDVIVPPEYDRYVIVSWGDRVFANPDEYFGYNCDYTGFIPFPGTIDDGLLFVNHEYISFPFSRLAPEVPADVKAAGSSESYPIVIGGALPSTRSTADRTDPNRIALDGEFLYNVGGSIVRISRRNTLRRFVPIKSDFRNRRIHGLSGLGVNSTRTDGYQTITAWGSKSYQQGDQNYLIGTGPAATQVFSLSVDGLGNKIIGTAFNCSGGTTPWGTILSCEENFQGSAGAFFVGVTEAVRPNGTQINYTNETTGQTFGLVGEKYGWVVEIDPASPSARAKKHTWLGRFRHENVALRVEVGKKLVAYLGDDRRGGHTWKFVSNGTVSSVTSKSNSALFENGVLYVAKFNPDGTGQWIPLLLTTATNPIPPSTLGAVEIAALGVAQRNGRLPLPRRNGIAGQTTDGGVFNCDTTNEATALLDYRSKTLSNFYTSQGAVLCDAFLAANLVGGTPTARPEDIEVHPTTKEVFIAYTDGAPGSDGYPDSRIFQVAKLSGAVNATQQSGGLYKLVEGSADATGTTFSWQRLEQGGEAGSLEGSGFANVDNLAFDSQANVWGVTDMSTSTHNGFDIGATGNPLTINHTATGNVSSFTGVFGNNWLFFIPTTGPNAGTVMPFAYGPVRCEITGPTFVGDTLIVAVQHPGEDCPIDDGTTLSRSIEMLKLDGTLFNQQRTVKRGSLWPANILPGTAAAPRSAVIGIQRRNSSGRFI